MCYGTSKVVKSKNLTISQFPMNGKLHDVNMEFHSFSELKEKGAELEKILAEARKEIIDVQNEKKTFMVRSVQGVLWAEILTEHFLCVHAYSIFA